MGGSNIGSEAFESMGKGATSPRAQRDAGEGQPATERGRPSINRASMWLDTVVPAAKGHIHASAFSGNLHFTPTLGPFGL